jgi:hypothetical protein
MANGNSEDDNKQIEELCRFALRHRHSTGAAKIFLSFFCGECKHLSDETGTCCELCGSQFILN